MRIDVATLPQRIAAAFIDLIPMTVMLLLLGTLHGARESPTGTQELLGEDLTGEQFGFLLLINLVYYGVSETVTGTTLGKAVIGLTVANEHGGRPNVQAALTRTVLRIVDGFPVLYLVGVLVASAKNNPKHQRVGDKLAKTQVVRITQATPDPMGEYRTDRAWQLRQLPILVITFAGVLAVDGFLVAVGR